MKVGNAFFIPIKGIHDAIEYVSEEIKLKLNKFRVSVKYLL